MYYCFSDVISPEIVLSLNSLFLKQVMGRKQWKAGEDYIMRCFVTCKLHQILLE